MANPTYDRMIADGKWFVFLKDGQVGWCDHTGKIVIQPQFDLAFPFNENELAPVMKDGKWGYINRKGVVKIPYQFDQVGGFINNKIAVVSLGDRFGFINREGKYIVNPQYDDVNDRFIEFVTFGILKEESIYSDYFDPEPIVNKVKELITDDAIDGIPYTDPIEKLMQSYGFKSTAFSKYSTSSIEVKRGKLLADGWYVIKVNGYPYTKETKGWFPNYVFNNGYVPESYTMEIELNWRKKNKTEMLFRELFSAFSNGTEVNDIRDGMMLNNHGEKVALNFVYNKDKISITTEKGRGDQRKAEDNTPLVSLNISGLGKYDSAIGKEYNELSDLPEFKGYVEGGGKVISVNLDGRYGLSSFHKNGTSLYVVEKLVDTADDKRINTIIDILEIKSSELSKNLYIAWTGAIKDGRGDENIVLIYQIDNDDDSLEQEYFSKINQAWRINESTGKFESIPVTGIICRNEGYGA
ncbi:MAG: WG repeat-containing protein [Candidatus Azobacteroides sp.]|nr:WG repeat-containing protein [Candidatus Azobacteroides sp.]